MQRNSVVNARRSEKVDSWSANFRVTDERASLDRVMNRGPLRSPTDSAYMRTEPGMITEAGR